MYARHAIEAENRRLEAEVQAQRALIDQLRRELAAAHRMIDSRGGVHGRA